MFRLTHYMEHLVEPKAYSKRKAQGPVVIWNLLRRCNLSCRHCYANSFDKDFAGELTLNQCLENVSAIKRAKSPAVILSGGEPLLHPHVLTSLKKLRSKVFTWHFLQMEFF